MEFFKKHYEKLILLGLFILFIVLMMKVVLIIDDTKAISAKDLDLPQRTPDHVEADAKDPQFDPENLWKQSRTNWHAPGTFEYHNPQPVYCSDLVNGFAIASCPYCEEKYKKENPSSESGFLRLIPHYYFNGEKGKNRKCPFCGNELLKPTSVKSVRMAVKTDKDIDGDGIPNEEEKRYRLNENDENDALYDADGDGFSNYYEIMVAKTNPRDPNSHPPLWYRLRIASVKQIVLPIKFMALNDNGKADKKEWMLQFNTPRRGKIDKSEFAQLGESLRIEKRFYKIVDIQKVRTKIKKQIDPATVKTVQTGEEKPDQEIDQSKVFLVEEIDDSDDARIKTPDKLVMICNETVYSSDKRPVLEDYGIPGGKKSYTVKKGNTFRIPDTRGRMRASEYRVVDIDAENMQVILEDIKNPKNDALVITREGKIPQDSRVIEARENKVEDTPATM